MAIPRAWSTPTTPGSGQLALSMHPSVNDRWQMERPPPRHKAPAFWRRRGGNHVGRMKGPQRQSRPGPRCPTDAAGDRGRACRVTGHHPPPFRGSLKRPPGVWGCDTDQREVNKDAGVVTHDDEVPLNANALTFTNRQPARLATAPPFASRACKRGEPGSRHHPHHRRRSRGPAQPLR